MVRLLVMGGGGVLFAVAFEALASAASPAHAEGIPVPAVTLSPAAPPLTVPPIPAPPLFDPPTPATPPSTTLAPGMAPGLAGGDNRATPAGAATLGQPLAWPVPDGATPPGHCTIRAGQPARGPPDRPG
jgi:hypothetical protein